MGYSDIICDHITIVSKIIQLVLIKLGLYCLGHSTFFSSNEDYTLFFYLVQLICNFIFFFNFLNLFIIH